MGDGNVPSATRRTDAVLLLSQSTVASSQTPPREHLLFVYGAMMNGEPEHPQLAEHGARLVGPATTDATFDLVDLGARPALVPGGTTAVRGEVYALSTAHLAKIDVHEGHPLRYRRGAVRLDDGRVVEAYRDRPGSGARAKADPHRRLARAARPRAAHRGAGVVPLGQRK